MLDADADDVKGIPVPEVVDMTQAEVNERKPYVPRSGKGTEGAQFAQNFLGAYKTGAPDTTVKLLDPLGIDYGVAVAEGNRRVRGTRYPLLRPRLADGAVVSCVFQGNVDFASRHSIDGEHVGNERCLIRCSGDSWLVWRCRSGALWVSGRGDSCQRRRCVWILQRVPSKLSPLKLS
jgi:hypothetical protein